MKVKAGSWTCDTLHSRPVFSAASCAETTIAVVFPGPLPRPDPARRAAGDITFGGLRQNSGCGTNFAASWSSGMVPIAFAQIAPALVVRYAARCPPLARGVRAELLSAMSVTLFAALLGIARLVIRSEEHTSELQ